MDNKEKNSKFKTIVMERIGSDSRGRDEADYEGQRVRFGFGNDVSDDAAVAVADDGFAANVRFSDPILSVTDAKNGALWRRDLRGNIATGLLLVSFAAVFCMMINEPLLIAYASPALIVFTALVTPESFDRVNIKYIACGVAAVLLLAVVVVFHSKIGPGLAYMMNEFYDVAEESQAYLYDRFAGGDGASEGDCRIAMLWISSLTALLMALVPGRLRRAAGMLLTAAVMLMLAYYGVQPDTICVAAMVLALLLTLSKDNPAAALPLMLVTVILFGAVTLIDPGESYGISRMNENVRDRIAFHSALIESGTPETEDPADFEDLTEPEAGSEDSSLMTGSSSYVFAGFVLLLAAAIGVAAYLLVKRFRKRRAAVREGIDSADPREAVTAMFPYSVRWLKASGIETREAPFAEMTDDVRRVYETAYAGRFREMYSLWREAAYSDHEITEADRRDMDRFTQDTIAMVSDRWNMLQRLRMRYKHAL